jgi:ABC-type Fe3+-hydroxamate transport system substrate-binding protein
MLPNEFPAIFTDQLFNKIYLSHLPQRIVSLVPSQTELLFDLGLGEKVVGVTKFCIHPQAEVKTKKTVGGTKNFNFEVIRQLQPDLIIGNKEENYQEGIRALQKDYPVWMSDIYNLTDALIMIEGLGQVTGTTSQAQKMVQEIKTKFAALPVYPTIPTAYFIWRKPYLIVGQNTFIHQMLQAAGFTNVFAHLNRYPEISPADLQKISPTLILLSSEPYPFKEKHIQELKEICPGAQLKLVDGELFSWYGSRIRKLPAYIRQLRQELAKLSFTL